MTGADRALLGLCLAGAVTVFLLAAGSRSDTMRILGYFIAAALAWGGIAYAFAVLSAVAAGGTMHP